MIEYAVDEAIEGMKANLNNEGEGMTRSVNNQDIVDQYTGKEEKTYKGQVNRLRLDWELSHEFFEEEGNHWDMPEIFDLMGIQMKVDLEDLIENGDTTIVSDPLLKTFDGSKKRGSEPKDVQIIKTVTTRGVGRGVIEYTVYILLYTEW